MAFLKFPAAQVELTPLRRTKPGSHWIYTRVGIEFTILEQRTVIYVPDHKITLMEDDFYTLISQSRVYLQNPPVSSHRADLFELYSFVPMEGDFSIELSAGQTWFSQLPLEKISVSFLLYLIRFGIRGNIRWSEVIEIDKYLDFLNDLAQEIQNI